MRGQVENYGLIYACNTASGSIHQDSKRVDTPAEKVSLFWSVSLFQSHEKATVTRKSNKH